MGDVEVDTTELRRTGRDLRLIAAELGSAERIVEDGTRALGHRRLAQRLDEFQGSWDDRRGDLLASIDALASYATQVGETYEEIESSLVAALRGDA